MSLTDEVDTPLSAKLGIDHNASISSAADRTLGRGVVHAATKVVARAPMNMTHGRRSRSQKCAKGIARQRGRVGTGTRFLSLTRPEQKLKRGGVAAKQRYAGS
jgi:hypothetical protein